MIVEEEIEAPTQGTRAQGAASLDEIRELLEDIRKQNLALKRYLFAFGVALAILLLENFFPLFRQILYVTVIVVLVAMVLLTAPVWSRFIGLLTERVPWLSNWSSKKPLS